MPGLAGLAQVSRAVAVETEGGYGAKKMPCFSCDPELKTVAGVSAPVQCLEATKVGQEWLNTCVVENSRTLNDRDLFTEPYPNVMDKIVIEMPMKFQFRITSSADLDHDKYCCGTKWLPLKPTRGFRKKAFTYLLNMPSKFCPMNWLGTEFQKEIFSDQDILRPMNMGDMGTFDKSNIFAVRLINGAYRHWLKHLPQNMITGIYKGPVNEQHHMDGLVAMVYHASNPQKVYYHSLEYVLSQSNIAAIEDGNFCIATMIGGEKLLWIVDSSKPVQIYEDEDIYSGLELTFQTYQELEDRYEDYLNDACAFHINRKSFNATLTNGTYVITSCDIDKEVNVQMYCVAKEDGIPFDWSCLEYDKPVGFSCRELQHRMPYHEVPVLFDYKKINKTNAQEILHADLCDYKKRVKRECLRDDFGVIKPIYLMIDPLVYDELMANKQQEEKEKRICSVFENQAADLERIKPIVELEGTGIHIFTTAQNFVAIYNPSHLAISAPKVYADHDCLNIKMRWSIMAGLYVKDFGVIGINLCNSPFSRKMKNRKPAEYELGTERINSACAIPCYCPDSCGSNYMEQQPHNCSIKGRGDIDVEVDINQETGQVDMNVSIMVPESTFTDIVNYSTTVYISDQPVVVSTLANFTVSFDSINDLNSQVINIVSELDAGGCGQDTLVYSWFYDGEVVPVEGSCPENVGFELVAGSGETEAYPNAGSVYLTGVTEMGEVTPIGNFLECVSDVIFDNSSGENVWEFVLNEGAEIIGKTFGIELSNYNCDSIQNETTIGDGISVVVPAVGEGKKTKKARA